MCFVLLIILLFLTVKVRPYWWLKRKRSSVELLLKYRANSMQCMNQLIIKITQAIESRFSDLNDVQFTEIANLSNWPVELKGISCIHLWDIMIWWTVLQILKFNFFYFVCCIFYFYSQILQKNTMLKCNLDIAWAHCFTLYTLYVWLCGVLVSCLSVSVL